MKLKLHTLMAFISYHDQQAEHLSMNYQEMNQDDLGAILETISQAFNHLYDIPVVLVDFKILQIIS